MSTDMHDVELVIRSVAQTAVNSEKYFGELDAVVGDGDFGYSLARGFERVLQDWDSFDRTSIGAFLKKIALVITSSVGGTSGPLWGTAFLRASQVAGEKALLSGDDIVAMLRAGVAGIKDRGNADVGDKTLLDALVPAIDELEQQLRSDSDLSATTAAMALAARNAADATSSMQAKRGRASYTGSRSVGSPDAGAVAIAVMLEQLATNVAMTQR